MFSDLSVRNSFVVSRLFTFITVIQVIEIITSQSKKKKNDAIIIMMKTTTRTNNAQGTAYAGRMSLSQRTTADKDSTETVFSALKHSQSSVA